MESRGRPLRAEDLTYNRTTSPKPVPSEAVVLASEDSICTDQMATARWKHGVGWSRPELKPYGPLSLMPTASCLYSATECFESLEAHRRYDGSFVCSESIITLLSFALRRPESHSLALKLRP